MPRIVYVLYHTHIAANGDADEKILGFYSTEGRARSRIEQARLLPGFRDAPDGFDVAACELDADTWTQGYRTDSGVDVPDWLFDDGEQGRPD
jgi:hypothetical protein